MLSPERILELVGQIYDSAADPTVWPTFCVNFADAVNGTSTGVLYYDWSAPEARLDTFVRFSPESGRQYVQRYYAINPWHLEWKKRVNRAGPESIEVSDELVPLASLEKTEFYNDYLRPQGQAHQMGCMLTRTDQVFCGFTTLRSRDLGPFGADEVALLRVLFPHLEKAVTFHRKVAELDGRHRASIDVLDRLSTGVILIDFKGRILAANRAAQQIIDQNDGLTARSDGLASATCDQTRQLRSMITATMRTSAGKGTSSGGSIGLARPSGKRPLSIIVAPVSRHAFPPDARRPAAIVFVSDPEAAMQSHDELLARLYSLTAAEGRLAGLLMEGESLVRVAERLGISHNTARTHLQRIYEKTGTSHQGELVRLILKGTPQLL